MPFISEPEPPRGVPIDVLPGIRKVVAKNPSVMTYHGTNTYLIDGADGLTVLDPGPDDAQHVQDIITAAGETPIKRLVLTHTHSDHIGALAALKAATGAAVYGYKISAKKKFTPEHGLDDGETIAGLTGVHTPGHAADHLCFEYTLPDGEVILFSGDHVMSWSSSIVSPPDGDMLHYYRSLELLLRREETLYLPGHGAILPQPRALVAELLAHRQHREASILKELQAQPWDIASLSEKLYAKTDPWLQRAAERNVLAHMLKLRDEGIVVEETPVIAAAAPDVEKAAAPGSVESESGVERLMRTDSQRRFTIKN